MSDHTEARTPIRAPSGTRRQSTSRKNLSLKFFAINLMQAKNEPDTRKSSLALPSMPKELLVGIDDEPLTDYCTTHATVSRQGAFLRLNLQVSWSRASLMATCRNSRKDCLTEGSLILCPSQLRKVKLHGSPQPQTVCHPDTPHLTSRLGICLRLFANSIFDRSERLSFFYQSTRTVAIRLNEFTR